MTREEAIAKLQREPEGTRLVMTCWTSDDVGHVLEAEEIDPELDVDTDTVLDRLEGEIKDGLIYDAVKQGILDMIAEGEGKEQEHG